MAPTDTNKKQPPIPDHKLLLLGSKVRITNLPVKEVSLLREGSLPAYGYNPGDQIELLAGEVSIEEGRLEQTGTWLTTYLGRAGLNPRIDTHTYGEPKEIFQIFRNRRADRETDPADGWFMFQQFLPPEGRRASTRNLEITPGNREQMVGNQGIMIIDDSGRPPAASDEFKELNPGAWVIAMGIGVAHWQSWARQFGDKFCLFCRLSDLETTRMEMDSSVIWETIVAMTLRALKTSEVGLWKNGRFMCHIIVEMFPHGIMYLGPDGGHFRHRSGCLPEKSSPRHKGSAPCYDTLATSLLASDWLQAGGPYFCRNAFFDYSTRLLNNWQLLHQSGYAFDGGLRFPELDFSSTYPNGTACSFIENKNDPCFIDLAPLTPEFEQELDVVSGQQWHEAKKEAVRDFFPWPVSSYVKEQMGSMANDCIGVIAEVLHYLKNEVSWKNGFAELRMFSVGNLRTTDAAEIEPVVTLQNVMDSYVSREQVQRPLCVGVFGPPGSGKSFAVKEVAKVIGRRFDISPFDFFEFNLTQFDGPEEINSAIDAIRASVAKGKVPIVFWDEFDCRYDQHEFGYLRYFLPSMQDGITYVHGVPYNIGRSIFVFAGGVKASYEGMAALLEDTEPATQQLVRTLKIPDFLSRLRVVLDIDDIQIPRDLLCNQAGPQELAKLRRILIKRAFIIAHQMDTHWKKAARKTSGLLLRLLLAEYKFGARSIEAVIEASGASDRLVYGLPELIAPSAARVHASWQVELERLVDLARKQQGLREIW
ncbi:AAA family ATPase [Desulfurivibrio dismutans]|uniref:AAA family ATPase n=1 Tax=Desulfurivibrio dismutans TaxID=1398908 RepID=UPI0023DA97EB|nr:AAA family ATPase [Desulfurivibrio alkaliphilus]MDF1614579.1 AAA family ATPase [Desulfurivibrio alkaliphilus]